MEGVFRCNLLTAQELVVISVAPLHITKLVHAIYTRYEVKLPEVVHSLQMVRVKCIP